MVPKDTTAVDHARDARDYTAQLIEQGYDGQDIGGTLFVNNPKAITSITVRPSAPHDLRDQFDLEVGPRGGCSHEEAGWRERCGGESGAERGKGGTSSKPFKKWFKDSAVVDDDGEPLTVYHGTTHNIEQFREAGSEGLNPESDWGAGVYFTSEPEDASENYAGEGPDLTNRIEQRADQLESDDLSHEEAVAQARKELAGQSASIIPAYISMQRPFAVGDPNGSSPARETRLEMEYEYEDPDDPDSDIVGETGTLPDFIAALRDEASQYDDNFRSGLKAVDKFVEQLSGSDSVTASELVKAWKASSDELIELP